MPSPTTFTNPHAGAGATPSSASTSVPTPPPLGTLIDDGTNAGVLQLATVLGYGGYGVVYRAVAPSGTLFAVKCLLRTSNPSNPKQAQRQRRLHMRETALHRLAGAGAHPGIVRLHRVIEPTLPAEDGSSLLPSPYTFLVMDYAPCGDLFTLILHRQVYLGRTGLVSQVFAQLAAAVSHCHSLGIYHRDLKPENVLCWDGGATVKLADFGLATTEHRSREWRTGSVYHMSPECQNGNSSSPPYSPLANDIWSLAILLLNLLTARNPWARASPSDPTFSAYLASPRNFLPQVLPISSALNDVLVRALDVRWERREMFGIDGLAEGVAQLVPDIEGSDSRWSLSLCKQQRMGMYAPDVVFEGGMARCSWEVGMHIPSGSSGSGGASHQMRIPQEFLNPPSPQTEAAQPKVARCRSSSASFVPSTRARSPSQPSIVEASEFSQTVEAEASVKVNLEERVKITPEQSSREIPETSHWSPDNSSSLHESSVSEIRFAHPSDVELTSSRSSSSTSSSEVSSVESAYSSTKANIPEPRVSDADLSLNDDAESYAYTYAASPDTPIDPALENSKPLYNEDVYMCPSYPTTRRTRYRGRSRGRQPYPLQSSVARRESLARRSKFQSRKQKPELHLNVDLPALLPMHIQSSGANGSITARSRSRSRSSPQRRSVDFRRHAQQESIESCPFAYSVSRSASFVHNAQMEIDAMRESQIEVSSQVDYDVHMNSMGIVQERKEAEMRFSRAMTVSRSFHTSFDGFSLSPSPIDTSPVIVIEDGLESAFRVTSSNHTLTSPISPTLAGVNSSGASMVKIERSTLAATSPTDVTSPRSPCDGYEFIRSSTPSVSSSAYQHRAGNRINGGYDMLDELMDTDEFRGGFRAEMGVRRADDDHSEESWVDELRRVVDEEIQHAMMDMDEFDRFPGLPGSFPTSPAASLKESPRQCAEVLKESVSTASGDGLVNELRLDLFPPSVSTHSPASPLGKAEENSARRSNRCSVPPPSIRSTNSADEALCALHAIAVNAVDPWTRTEATVLSTESSSSVSTNDAQTFMAITTDSTTGVEVDVQQVASSTAEDFREYAPYLHYGDSPIVTSPVEIIGSQSKHSFRASFRSNYAARVTAAFPSSQEAQRKTVPESRAYQPDSRLTKRRSRSKSLLKFVSRRPLSSSSSGFLPSCSSQSPSAVLDTKSGINLETGARARFSTAGKVGGRISTALSDGTGDKLLGPSASVQTSRPRSKSNPAPGVEQSRNQRISSPASATPISMKKVLSRKPSRAGKLRTWSFTRSRSQYRRRSRSTSPSPTKGSPRHVLFRLRSARNWFWYALSNMTSRSSSGSRPRAKKGMGMNSKWGPSS